ncbi:unnamed protein product [Toxocara canis]|uniref:Carbonic anhydrase n=1 Tax=Toxocara canis TaxID=6265 RepID=A0A3P7IVR9_TOXCA|nr:unnamed protein product [Toxocara canis]
MQGFTAWPQQPMLSGGGLTGRYMLQQFHFHWDQSRDLGSEHTIDKLHYALEAHFVHALENLTIEQAARIPYGIAILAVFFAISDTPSQLRQLENLFDMTTAFGSYNSVTYRANDLLPEDREVWFLYSGSLTTPPCSENVIWTLLAEPIYVEESQLEELRHRVSNTGALLVRNRREVQPLNNRVIYMRARKGNGAAHSTTYTYSKETTSLKEDILICYSTVVPEGRVRCKVHLN